MGCSMENRIISIQYVLTVSTLLLLLVYGPLWLAQTALIMVLLLLARSGKKRIGWKESNNQMTSNDHLPSNPLFGIFWKV